jgi:hypothetical protein
MGLEPGVELLRMYEMIRTDSVLDGEAGTARSSISDR